MKYTLLLFIVLLCFTVSFSQVQNVVIVSTKCTVANDLSVNDTGGANSNLATAGRFYVPLLGGFWVTNRTYVEYDLSGIPSNAIITSANLKIYVESTTGAPNIYAGRIEQSWQESTLSWNNKPSHSTTNIITSSSMTGTYWLTFNVKDHVQKMVANVYPNNGWVLYHNNETETVAKNRTFRSDDHVDVNSRPKLEVSYYIPMSVVAATIDHESHAGANNGSVKPVLQNGPGGTYSYQWFNAAGSMPGKTALNLTGVPYGWYGLRVTSSIAGTEQFYYAFLVGLNCEEVEIEFNPGPNFIDDAPVQGPIEYENAVVNFGSENYIVALDFSLWSTVVQNRTLIRFRLWVDQEINLTESVMQLKGIANDGTRSNESHLKRVVEQWQENIVTHSSMPATSTDILVNVPEMLSPTEIKNIDVLDFWQHWRENNVQNYGFLFELQLYNSIYTTQGYHSSDATTASDRPKVTFKMYVSDPIPPNYCDQVFAKMDRMLRGVRYRPYLSHLYFYYDEEYDHSTSLNYNVYRDGDAVNAVLNATIQPLTGSGYGDNRHALNVSSLQEDNYILEIMNNKQEKFYLRFKIED